MRKILKEIATPKDLIGEDSNYIGYIDFKIAGISEQVLTIKTIQVDEVNIPKTTKTQKKNVIVFSETQKGLTLNKTNRDELTRLFGELKNWPGNKIKIVADHSIMFGNKNTGGLRIKGVNS